MYIRRVKKVESTSQNKCIKYYSNRGYRERFREMLEDIKKEIEEEIQLQSELEEQENIRDHQNYESVQSIYNRENIKAKNSLAYKKMDKEESKNRRLEHTTSHKIRVIKMMDAYNKRMNNKKEISEQIEKSESKEQTHSKKEEMQEFKKSLKAKNELDSACEELSRVLAKRNIDNNRARRTRYNGQGR